MEFFHFNSFWKVMEKIAEKHPTLTLLLLWAWLMTATLYVPWMLSK